MSDEATVFLAHWARAPGPFNVQTVWFKSAHGWGKAPASCVRMKDGRFHVFQRGEYRDLLCGSDFILASPRMANVLERCCGEEMRLVPTQLVNAATDTKLADYCEVLPLVEVTTNTIRQLDATGYHVWHYRRQFLVVTKAVAVEFLNSGVSQLHFEKGLAHTLYGETARSGAGCER
jgi:hypothetical protein